MREVNRGRDGGRRVGAWVWTIIAHAHTHTDTWKNNHDDVH